MNTTERRAKTRPALPLLLLFCIITAIIFIGRSPLTLWGFNLNVLLTGNTLLFALSLLSLLLYQRAMQHKTTIGFLRNTYVSLFLKLLVCIIVMMVYVFSNRQQVNKPGILGCALLYVLYTILEMRSLLQWNKARTNA